MPIGGTRRVALVAAMAIALVSIASGCGSDSSTRQSGVGPDVGAGTNVGAPINLADCTDWNQASVAERLGTIAELEQFAGGPVVGSRPDDPSGTGVVLDEEEAYDLLTGYCEPELARGFKLYKLYERAAAFSGVPQSASSG